VDALSLKITAASRREGMRRDLARLVERHSPIFDDVDGVPPGYVRCNWGMCGWMAAPQPEDEEAWGAYWWHPRHAEHLAEVIVEDLTA
jgi:hypothetical protein